MDKLCRSDDPREHHLTPILLWRLLALNNFTPAKIHSLLGSETDRHPSKSRFSRFTLGRRRCAGAKSHSDLWYYKIIRTIIRNYASLSHWWEFSWEFLARVLILFSFLIALSLDKNKSFHHRPQRRSILDVNFRRKFVIYFWKSTSRKRLSFSKDQPIRSRFNLFSLAEIIKKWLWNTLVLVNSKSDWKAAILYVAIDRWFASVGITLYRFLRAHLLQRINPAPRAIRANFTTGILSQLYCIREIIIKYKWIKFTVRRVCESREYALYR